LLRPHPGVADRHRHEPAGAVGERPLPGAVDGVDRGGRKHLGVCRPLRDLLWRKPRRRRAERERRVCPDRHGDRRLRRLSAHPMTRVLVVGGGGREHAIVRALKRSPRTPDVLCAPGNAGIAEDARCFERAPSDVDALVRVANDEQVDLTVVGPEAPLVAGLVDALEEQGLRAFGPSAAAAELEGSKVFAKQLMREAGIPTASNVVFDSYEQAAPQMDCASYPAVLKADGLAAGKGVIIASNPREARKALEGYFVERRFGEAGGRVVVEEYLEGEELSLLALCDGENVLPMAPARDYKRIHEGDRGPNTGGMGSYSPVPEVGAERAAEIAA